MHLLLLLLASLCCAQFTIPARQDPSVTGSSFMESIINLPPGQERDQAILKQLKNGNIPDFLRTPIVLTSQTEKYSAQFWILSDYLSIGTDQDFVRIPMTPLIGQQIADLYNASFSTRKLVNLLWAASQTRLDPQPMGPPYDKSMQSTKRFLDHNTMIQTQLNEKYPNQNLTGFVQVGHKKDIVLTPLLNTYPKDVAIFGWIQANGTAIQPLNPRAHSNQYADYSHGLRLVSNYVVLEGSPTSFAAVLASSDYSIVMSDEGPSTVSRQPGVKFWNKV